jgi:predicted Ser/Thr protein kinase
LSIYKDHPHKIDFIEIADHKVIKKSTHDASIHRKEFELQKVLNKKVSSVPLVWGYHKEYFYEEYIDGKTFNQLESNEKTAILPLIVKAINRIHDIEVDENIKTIFNSNTKKFTYDPNFILGLIVDNNIEFVKKNVPWARILNLVRESCNIFANLDYYPSVIHGDFSGNNIILSGNKIHIIDWTDSRIDIGLCDIIQFCHLTNLSTTQESLLIENYKNPINMPEVVKLLKIFFSLYDLIDSYKKEKIIDNKLINKIEGLINE